MRHRTGIAALALTATLAAAGVAHADSIAYVKDGDVWLSTADGSRQYRVTATGGYSDVSQADDGTMIALAGVRLHRLSRTGEVLADFDTPVSDTRPPGGGKAFHGPFDPAISPDGSKVAYTYYYVANSQNPSCFPPTCFTASIEGGTGYSFADRQTAWDVAGLGRHSGWLHPAWIDDDDVMLSEPTHKAFNHDVITDTLGDGVVPVKDWFSDLGTTRLGGGDITRQRTALAFVGGDGDSQLRVMAMQGPEPAKPAVCFFYGPPAGAYDSPTFSPSGRALAFADADGVKVADLPDFSGGCTTEGASPTPRLLVAGASEPDWGPADVPPARPEPAAAAAPGTARPAAGGAAGGAAGAGRLAVTARAAAKGRSVRLAVAVPGAGRLSAVAKVGRTVVGRMAPRTVRGPKAVVTVSLTPKGRRAVAAGGRVLVTVSFRGAGGAARSATTTLRPSR